MSNKDELAQVIATLGLVTRQGSRFVVKSPTLHGQTSDFEVWRDESGKIRCSCFQNDDREGISDCCEHILSVKHALTIEMAGEQPMNGKSDIAEDSKEALQMTNLQKQQVKVLNSKGQPAYSKGNLQYEKSGVEGTLNSLEAELHSATELSAAERKMAVVKEAGETGRTGTQEEASMRPTSAPIAQPLQFSCSFRELNEEESSSGRTPDRRAEESRVLEPIDDAEWQTAVNILDGVAPKWSYSVRAVQMVGNMIVVIVSVTVDGVTREGVGAGSGELEVALRTAEDEALKRAANKFGFARLQAHSNTELVEQKIVSKDVGGFPCDPQARSMAELVMPRQLGIMRALARESGVDADKESMQVLHCKTEELSKRAASSFIEYLQLLPFKKPDRLRKAS